MEYKYIIKKLGINYFHLSKHITIRINANFFSHEKLYIANEHDGR